MARRLRIPVTSLVQVMSCQPFLTVCMLMSKVSLIK